ncbi:YjbQ family protein [candidate division KSB3 bacterium]|uniref:YjbQ family protein n=1 Tax=candidate division KSB3 bacterium TaxID=2044937 RepID=A0A9D5JUK9_9BACT|nr:YjbQ family protein [candidate division KSB3 bacterium]MBD3324542.1 YjbQ family protein [candidate division KSB3 bacterium]
MVRGKEITLQTQGFSDIHNITQQVQEVIAASGITAGLVNVSVIGSTASISTIEYESALVEDVQNELEKWVPRTLRSLHSQTWGDDNGFSHIRATFMGPGITLPVVNGAALLGTWQQIIVLDHDNRPRTRRIYIQVMGEASPER